MQVQLFGVLLVLEAQLVAGRALFRRAAAQDALGLVGRQRGRRGVFAVVDGAGHQRALRVAIQVGHHHLLADARQHQRAEAVAGHRLRHPQPGRALVVLDAVAVPRELHLDAAVLVGPDFFAAGADHQRRLAADRARARRLHRRAKRHGGRKRLEGIGVQLVARRMVHAAQHEGRVQRGDEMLGQGELAAGAERVAKTVAAQYFGIHLARLDAQLGQRRGGGDGQVAGGEFVHFALAAGGRMRAFERGAGLDEIVVVDGRLLHRDGVLPGEARHRVDRVIHAGARKEAHRGAAGAIGEGGAGVGQHHGVAAAGKREKVKDAGLLHQPADEVEGGLVVLHAVIERGIGLRGLVVEGDGKITQHGGEDFLDALGLVDLAVARQGQQPQHRHQFRFVVGEIAVVAALDKARHHAGDVARGAAFERHRHRHALADDGGGGQAGAA